MQNFINFLGNGATTMADDMFTKVGLAFIGAVTALTWVLLITDYMV